jgi:enterochelin esterase-like enzyme
VAVGVRPRAVLGGSSLGGLAAAYAVLRRPDLFGKAQSQSGAFGPNGRNKDDAEPAWLARPFAQAPASTAFFCVEVGSYESGIVRGATLLASNRHLRDVLQLKGFKCRYVEIPGDREPVHLRRGLADGLMAVLGGKARGGHVAMPG